MYTYLLVNIFTILFPVFRSFEPKIKYAQKWWYLFPSIFLTGLFFIVWDHFFTNWNVWSFNDAYIVGWYIFSLPLEEWLFFLTVPFACVFIYEVLKLFFPKDPLKIYANAITLVVIVTLFIVAILNFAKLYTFICFSFAATGLSLHWFFFRDRYLGMFYFTYLVHLVPFLIVNGILTYLPIVRYNDLENLGIRIFTIPIEDTVYSFLLLLMNISFYEFFKNRSKHFA